VVAVDESPEMVARISETAGLTLAEYLTPDRTWIRARPT
jgi:hypothetical protein